MKQHDKLVIAFMFKHTPEEFVRLIPGIDDVDWQQVLDSANRFSSGECAVVALAAFMLDRPGIFKEFSTPSTTLPSMLGQMDAEVRMDALECIVLWAITEQAE